MAAKSGYLADAVLNHVLRATAFSSPATVYFALYVGDPFSGGTEVSGGAYARQAVTFSAPDVTHTLKNSALVTFPTATASWGTVTHGALADASSGGNLLYGGALTNPKTVDVDDTVRVNANDLTVQET